MSERFFSSEVITGDRATLVGPEAHHLLHVMRAGVGDAVTLFDGGGAEFDAVVESLGRSEVRLQILTRREVNRELAFPLTVGVALPKGDRQKWLVEKLTELGVALLVPLITERSVAQPTAGTLDRLRRAVIEAAKQCGRNRLMDIAEPHEWTGWISHSRPAGDRWSPDNRWLLAHPRGIPLPSVNLDLPLATHLAIGPEGGFTDAEIAAATTAGWQPVAFGPRILRVETAAVAFAAAVALHA